MKMVHRRDSVDPSDKMLTCSHFGHTAVTHGTILVSSSVMTACSSLAPPVTRTEA